MEPRVPRLALLAALLAGCGGSPAIRLAPAWTSAGVAIPDDVFGHNTVWAEGGLGIWDDVA